MNGQGGTPGQNQQQGQGPQQSQMGSNPVQAMFDQNGTATLQGNMQADGFPGLPQFITPEVANTILTQRAGNARTGLEQGPKIVQTPYENLSKKALAYFTMGPRTQETLANTDESKARASLYNRTDPNLRSGGDPTGQGLSHMNAMLQGLNTQEQAINDRLTEMGFISQDSKTKGALLKPNQATKGFLGFGGAPGDSPQTTQEYETLVSRLNQIRAMKSNLVNQYSGGGTPSMFSGGQAGNSIDDAIINWKNGGQ